MRLVNLLINYLRILILNMKGNEVSYHSKIWKNVIVHGSNLVIRKNSGIGDNVVIWANDRVYIGKGVLVAANSVISSAGHPTSLGAKQEVVSEPISINDNCWIGANSTILPGVSMGADTIVAAGSVVNKKANIFLIEGKVIVGGVPVRKIKNV